VIQTEASGIVAAPPSEVYALLNDPPRFDELNDISGELVSDEELADGTRALHVRTHPPKGGAVDSHTVFVERVPDERVVLRHMGSPTVVVSERWLRFGRFESERALTLEAHSEGTLVTVKARSRARPALLHLYLRFVNRDAMREATEGTLERLRTAVSPSPQ
jgi:hypothetical protein